MSTSHESFDPLKLAYQPKKRFSLRLSKKWPGKRKFLGVMLAIIIAGALVTVGYIFKPDLAPKEDPALVAQREAQMEVERNRSELISAVGKQISLPPDEEPLIATVSDENQLKSQEFFQEAKKGDQILLYPKNKTAFLYRPSIKRVLVTAPLRYMPGGGSEVAGEATESAKPNQETEPQPQTPAEPEPEHGKVLIDNQD